VGCEAGDFAENQLTKLCVI